jgi:GGDEF domain-containing protein
VSVYPQDGHDAGTLIANADVAMYRAKDLGATPTSSSRAR